MELPGIYVEVRADYDQFQREMREARAMVKEQATGISNALNNALSPGQISGNVNKLVANFGTLNRASVVTGTAFDKVGVDLRELSKNTGLTESQFSSLQSRLIKTQAANAQERALRAIARATVLTKKEVRELGAQFGMSSAQIKKVNTQLNRTYGHVDKTGKSFFTFGNVVKTALAYMSVQQLWEFGKAAFGVSIQMDTMERSMTAISGSNRGMATELAELRGIAKDAGQDFYKLTNSYRQLSAATKGTAMSTAATRKVFKSVTEAAAVLGLSSHRTGLAIEALSQMASKGKVSMEELRRQLGDHIPGALGIAARAMDVPIKELYRMVEAGELMASDLLPRLADELHNMYGEAAQTAALESGQASVNRLSQAWTDFKVNVSDIDATVTAINKVSGAIEWMSEKAKLRSVWGTFTEGARLAQKGLLDFEEFTKASYAERQNMVDSLTRTEMVAADHFIAVWQAAEAQGLSDYTAYTAKKAEIQAASDTKGYESLQKYIETNQQRLEREYNIIVKFARTDEERAAATQKYNETLEALATKTEKTAVKAQYAGAQYASFTQELFLMKEAGVTAGSQLALIEGNFDDLGKAGEKWEKQNAQSIENIKDQAEGLADVFEDVEEKRIQAIEDSMMEESLALDEQGEKWKGFWEELVSGSELTTESLSSNFGDFAADVIVYNEDIGESFEALMESMLATFVSTLAEMAAEYAASEVWDWFTSESSSSGNSNNNGNDQNWLEDGADWIGEFFSFAEGGYTGSGGKNEPAGIVHRGEYVFTAEEVDALGLGTLRGLSSMPGYAVGGHVGPVAASPVWLNESQKDRETRENTKETKENTTEVKENTSISTEAIEKAEQSIETMSGNIEASGVNTGSTNQNTIAISGLSSSLSEFGRATLEALGTIAGGIIGGGIGSFAGPIGAIVGAKTGKRYAAEAMDELTDSWFGEDDWNELSKDQQDAIDKDLHDFFSELDEQQFGVVGVVSPENLGLSPVVKKQPSSNEAKDEESAFRSEYEDTFGEKFGNWNITPGAVVGGTGGNSGGPGIGGGGIGESTEGMANEHGGWYASGGVVDRLMIPNGDDGWGGLSFGEGVVNPRGMEALARINDGSFGGGDLSQITSRLDKLIAQNGKESVELNIDGQKFKGWINRTTSTLIARREKQGATGRIYV